MFICALLLYQGKGKDAVFLARNGYHVSAFDLAETGVEKGRALASQHGVYVDFFTACC